MSAVRTGKHIVLYGPSGAGKSWLYKFVFGQIGVFFTEVNLSSAGRLGSIDAVLREQCIRFEPDHKSGYVEKKGAATNVVVATGTLEHTATFATERLDALARLFQSIRKTAGAAPAFLVLENLEHLGDDGPLLDELGAILTRLDETAYAALNVRLLLVTTRDGLSRYFRVARNRATIANRLTELPMVFRLLPEEARELVRKGFCAGLGYDVGKPESFSLLTENILWRSDRLPQHMQELCLFTAIEGERTSTVGLDELVRGQERWLSGSMQGLLSTLQRCLNDSARRGGPRDQVLYALSLLDEGAFDVGDVAWLLSQEFPPGLPRQTIRRHLRALSSDGLDGLLAQDGRGAYSFCDPRMRACLRSVLSLVDGPGGRVLRLQSRLGD